MTAFSMLEKCLNQSHQNSNATTMHNEHTVQRDVKELEQRGLVQVHCGIGHSVTNRYDFSDLHRAVTNSDHSELNGLRYVDIHDNASNEPTSHRRTNRRIAERQVAENISHKVGLFDFNSVDGKALAQYCRISPLSPAKRDADMWPVALQTLRDVLPDDAPDERAEMVAQLS